MEEQFISFETAKLAKEKEFKRPFSIGLHYKKDKQLYGYGFLDVDEIYYFAPTQSLLQKWLREVHNLHIEVQNVNNPTSGKWMYEIALLPVGILVLWDIRTSPNFDSFEEALEAGLLNALKLIV